MPKINPDKYTDGSHPSTERMVARGKTGYKTDNNNRKVAERAIDTARRVARKCKNR